jgi:hypothetical protein
MKLPIKSLSILAIGGMLAGTVLAGPGDAYPSYTASIAIARAEKKKGGVTIAPFRTGVTRTGDKAKAEKTQTAK